MIKSVQKSIRILQIIADADGQCVKLDTISKQTGINKSTCSHILDTLVSENFVEQVSRTQGYRIGFGVFMLTRFGRFNHQLISSSRPVCKRLTEKTGQTTLICIPQGGKRICIDLIQGDMILLNQYESIMVEEMHNSATGQVLIAYMNETDQKEYYEKLTSEGFIGKNEEEIKSILKQIKMKGHAKYCHTKNGVDLGGYAAPIFYNGKCIAALGLAFFEDNEVYRKYVISAAKVISGRLSHSANL